MKTYTSQHSKYRRRNQLKYSSNGTSNVLSTFTLNTTLLWFFFHYCSRLLSNQASPVVLVFAIGYDRPVAKPSKSEVPLFVRQHLNSLLKGSEFRGGGEMRPHKKAQHVNVASIHLVAPVSKSKSKSKSNLIQNGQEDLDSDNLDHVEIRSVRNHIRVNYFGLRERILDHFGLTDNDFTKRSSNKDELDFDFNDKQAMKEDTKAWPAYDAPTATPTTSSEIENAYASTASDVQDDDENKVYSSLIKIMPGDRDSDSESDFHTFLNEQDSSYLQAEDVDVDVYEDDSYDDFSSMDQFTTSEHHQEQLYCRISNPVTSTSQPVVYRYFGRARSKFDSIPLILLGPCADHWKETGKVLASRGYSVMACEEVKNANSNSNNPSITRNGDGLVFAILEALRWKRAVIVGCDGNARAAIEAAIHLAPDRVAGLVLCGDLTDAENQLMELYYDMNDLGRKSAIYDTLDDLLQDNVFCPYTIICDGDVNTVRSNYRPEIKFNNNQYPRAEKLRTTIVGGGLSPHRRLPEQFAWALSRFIEESVISDELVTSTRRRRRFRTLYPNDTMQHFFSPGSLLVTGRVVASTIMYLSAASVFLYQYKNLQCGLSGLKSQCRQISVWQRQGIEFIVKILASDLYRKNKIIRNLVRRFRREEVSDKEEPHGMPSMEIEISPEREKEEEKNDDRVFQIFGFDYITS